MKKAQEIIDWSIPNSRREKLTKYWQPNKQLLKAIRQYQKYKSNKISLCYICKVFIVLKHRFWSIVTGAEIDLSCQIGRGLLIPHPNGIVIHPDAEIGVNCLIFQQVTITGGVRIGYHVDIGAGAKIIGPINIGNNVIIGANSVVTKDIPSNVIVAGVPAKKIRDYEESSHIKYYTNGNYSRSK